MARSWPDGTRPEKPPLPSCTNLPFQASPTGIQTSSRMLLSWVGRLVTAILQMLLPPAVSVVALVTSACGSAAFARSSQGVSACATAGAASPRAAAIIKDADFMWAAPPKALAWEDLNTAPPKRLGPGAKPGPVACQTSCGRS